MMNNETEHKDGWVNELTGLNSYTRDKRMQTYVAAPPDLTETELSNLFDGDYLAQRIAVKPAQAITRKWFEVTSEESEDLNKDLQTELDVLDAKTILTLALTWERAFGGCLVILGIDDGQDDQSLPVREESIREIRYLHLVPRFSAEIVKWDNDPRSSNFGKPEIFRLRLQNTVSDQNALLSSIDIHSDRVLWFEGALCSNQRRVSNKGWGESVYTAAYEVIRDFEVAFAGTSFLLQDFSQSIFKMKGLADALSRSGASSIVARLQAMDMSRSMTRSIVLDADGEEYERHTASVSGLSDLLQMFMYQVSAAVDMPATVLFGRSPAGLSATGDSDMRVWYDEIAEKQGTYLKFKLEKLIHYLLVARDGPTGGSEPDNWTIKFGPLYSMDEQQQATLHSQQAQADQIYLGQGVVSAEEIRQSRFGKGDYSLTTELSEDVSAEEIRALLNEPVVKETVTPVEEEPAQETPRPEQVNE